MPDAVEPEKPEGQGQPEESARAGSSLSLHPDHRADLRERSGLSDQSILTAGIRSLAPGEWPRYLSPRLAATVQSCYVLPYPDADGFYRAKLFPPVPDKDGHTIRYYQPAGTAPRLYLPPRARAALADPSVPLWITEGEKKALKADQEGLACAALGGLWSWLLDGAPLPDLDRVDWCEREVLLVPDSDVWLRPDLLRPVYALGRELEARGGRVQVVKLPAGEDGAKLGLDDYLCRHAAEALRQLSRLTLSHKSWTKTLAWWRGWSKRAAPEGRSASPEGGARPAAPYRLHDGRICRERQTPHGILLEPLSNFAARVTEELVLDDGAEPTRAFLLEGRLDTGEALPPVRVPAPRFTTMSWVTEAWGLRAVVRAGQATRDYLREAIQRLSPEAQRRRVFTHTGWREIEGQWVYLTAAGAVGREGFEVDLGPELARYRLPREAEDPGGAMRVSLTLLELAPWTVAVPLWAGAFRAPLASACPLDLSLWLEAATGSLKSTLAALFLSHWGEFDRTSLPGTWSSTANQLERRAFVLKDALFVVDDYAPSGLDARELETKAARLIRSQGNLAGRGRLRGDLTERPSYPPRGLLLSTGEQHPPGQSLLARMLLIELERAEVDVARLAEAQRQASRLPHAMAGYVSWLAPQMPKLPALLRETFEGARARASTEGEHLRVPEALAHLWLGFHAGLSYAEEIAACSGTEAQEIRARGWEALSQLGRAQGHLVEGERPTRRFLAVLLTLLTQRRAVLLPKDQSGEGVHGEPVLVGWLDEEGFYLLPDAAFGAVSRFCRDMGEPFPVRHERLKRDLAREGIAECDPGRYTTVARVGGQRRRVLRLRRRAVEGLLEEEFPAASPVVTGVTGFGE